MKKDKKDPGEIIDGTPSPRGISQLDRIETMLKAIMEKLNIE